MWLTETEIYLSCGCIHVIEGLGERIDGPSVTSIAKGRGCIFQDRAVLIIESPDLHSFYFSISEVLVHHRIGSEVN